MLVSDSRKLVFVHIQKTGGSTVHRLLEANVPDLNIIKPTHQFAIQGIKELEGWDEYYKFAFVRNPWDRLVSWYSMVTKFKKWNKYPLWQYVRDNSSTFEEFIYNCTDEVEIREGVHYSFAYNQLDYVTDKNGNLLVDFIGRLENFDEDVREAFSRIGIELKTIPHKNRSRHKHYSEFYTPETEMIVRERFKKDIEYFGYQFQRPYACQGAEFTEAFFLSAEQDRERRFEAQANRASEETRVEARANRTSRNELSKRPKLLFVCGCDRSGTTTFADYLNRHPEILICQERFKATVPQEEITPDLFTFERIGNFRPGETENPIWKNGHEFFVKYHTELLAKKDPATLKWIGDKNPNYVRNMDLMAGNNPGARFIVMYRPIEEVAESWEARAKDPDDHWNSDRGFQRAVKTWNLALRKTREFIENSVAPRVRIIDYHDFFYHNEAVVPLISRFLGIEFEEFVTKTWADATLAFDSGRRPKRTLSQEQHYFIQEHADRATEAWILDRVEKQWKKPGLYVQKNAKAALEASMDKMEARSWQLQRRVKNIELDLAHKPQENKSLRDQRSWRLLNKINSIRIRVVNK